MTQPIITIEKAIKSYKSLRVIDKLNWQVNEGDIVGLLGKNAAGKHAWNGILAIQVRK